MKNTFLDISVVIPVYNSSDCLAELALQLSGVLNKLDRSYEVILVDDSSPDASWPTIVGIVKTFPFFRGVQTTKNFGQTKATSVGLGLAKGKIVITMDDDLQHNPAFLPRLFDEFKGNGGCDFLYAYFPDKKHAAYRNVASRVLSWINSQAVGGGRSVKLSSFRLMKREIAKIISENACTSVSIAASVFACTSNIRYVAIPHQDRYSGKSNYTLLKQLKLAFDNICNVSLLPLRLISGVGIFVACASGFFLVYIIFKYFLGGISAAGWTSTVALITFFSGLILLSLGIIGEYIVRILRAVQAPTSIPIRDKVGFSD